MIQIISCPCNKVFSACREPECLTDPWWHKEVRKYVKKGCTVKTVERITLEECKCKDFKPSNAKDPNQLSIK